MADQTGAENLTHRVPGDERRGDLTRATRRLTLWAGCIGMVHVGLPTAVIHRNDTWLPYACKKET
jgi:hypothetical protein